MKSTLILTKILLKNALNANKEDINSKAIAKKIFLFLAIAYVAFVMAYLSKEIIVILKDAYQAEAFISICLLMTAFVSLFRSIISSLSVLYFSKDIEYLLPLPVSPLQIIFAKFNVMLVSSYITELLTFAIPFIVYGVVMEVEPIFYLMSAIVFFALPIIPTLIGAFFIVILMKFTNFLKNKDMVQYIITFMTFAFVIVLQIFISSNSEMTNFMVANKLLEIDGISNMIGDYIIILKQAINAITEFDNNQYIINALYLVGEGITAYLLSGIIASKLYIESATNVVSGKSKKANSQIKVEKIKGVGKVYISKEFKTLFRTPSFCLNLIIPILIIPVLLAIPLFNATGSTNLSQEQMNEVIKLASRSIESTFGFAIVFSIINFLYMFNFISVTAISRDGENAIFMKYIPIPLNKQCRYKAIPNFVFNLYPLIIVIVVLKLVFKEVSNLFILELALVSLLSNIFLSYFTIIIDILRPKLHWTSEYSVIKQNINIFWATIFMLLFTIAMFGICSFFENVHIITALISAILIFTTYCYDCFIKKNYINLFRKVC